MRIAKVRSMLYRESFLYYVYGNHVLFGAGILRMTIGRCRYLSSFFSKLLYPVVKSADSNAVFAAPVNTCHTTGSALIDKFQLFFFWNSGFSGVCLILLLVSVCSPYSPFVKRKRLSPLSDIYFSS